MLLENTVKKRTNYYYATKEGQLPMATEAIWYKNINDSNDL